MGGISFRGYFVLRKPYSPNTHMGQMGARAKLTCDLGGRSRVDSTGFPLGEEDMKVGEEAEWFFWIDGMKIKQPARCRLRVTYEDEGTKKTYLLHDHGYDLTP